MKEFLAAVMITHCYIWGIRLRYSPFAPIISVKQRWTLGIIYFIALVTNIALLTVIIQRYGVNHLYVKLNSLIFSIITALVNKFVVLGHWKEHLFLYGITSTVSHMMTSGPIFAADLIVGLSSLESYILATFLYGIILLIIFKPCRSLLRYTVEHFLFVEAGDYWTTVWFLPVGIYFSLVLSPAPTTMIASILQIFSWGAMGSVMILLCLSVAQTRKRLMEKKVLSEQLLMQKAHYTQLQTKVEDARKASHDYLHHISAIQGLVDNHDLDGVKKYCDDLLEKYGFRAQIPYTGNPGVDGIVYRYMKICKEHNIEFSYRGTITANNLPDIELCVLMGNALDNAVSGCLTVEEGRSITAVAEETPQFLSILIRNTFDGNIEQAENVFLSRKRDQEPGIGMSTMRSICERNGGTMHTQWDANTFTIMFMLRKA